MTWLICIPTSHPSYPGEAYPKAPPLVALYLLFEVSDAPLLSMFRIKG